MGRFLRRVRGFFPLTTRGVGLVACAGLALFSFGFEALDQVWYVLGLGLLALAAVALLVVLAASLRFYWHVRRGPQTVAVPISFETGREQPTGFRVPALRFWPFVDVRVELSAPAQLRSSMVREGAFLSERVVVGDHGEVRQVERTFELADVFGLAALRFARVREVAFDVLPHLGRLRTLPFLRSLSGGDDFPHPLGVEQGDRLELRRYAPGDPARFIHWKVFARTQKLVVRMPERALARAHRVAAYLIAGNEDGASAAAARVALEEHAFGDDYRFGADGSPVSASDVASGLVAIRRSAAARDRSAQGLRSFVAEVERQGPTSLILFVPAKLGSEAGPVRALLAARTHPARVIVGIDGVPQTKRARLWRKLAFREPPPPAVAAVELLATIRFYRQLAAEVVVVDRTTGRVLSDAHLQKNTEAA